MARQDTGSRTSEEMGIITQRPDSHDIREIAEGLMYWLEQGDKKHEGQAGRDIFKNGKEMFARLARGEANEEDEKVHRESYKGYIKEDFEELLRRLEKIEEDINSNL
jgi:hypothetical protein